MTRLLTLLPMACDGVGPSYTCTSLLRAMAACGLKGPLYVNRVRAPLDGLHYRSAVPWFLAGLPYRVYAGPASRRTERRFLADLRAGDIAYLWPAAGLRAYEAAAARDIPIIAEGINTRMAFARDILDAAYLAEGQEPAHGITDARIREEDEKLAMTTAIFAPSSGVEHSLADSPVASEGIIPASYGTALAGRKPRREPGPDAPVFLFVGYGSIRKGLHVLLRAWAAAKTGGTLLLAGAIEPAVQTLCADLLNRNDVQPLGFVRDVDALYSRADVFVLPSFEEGDPLVTYEAAAHGLPIIASPMGAGRMGSETGCTLIVDPGEPETITAMLRRLAMSAEARAEHGRQSLAAVRDYDWSDVGRRRAERLRELLARN